MDPSKDYNADIRVLDYALAIDGSGIVDTDDGNPFVRLFTFKDTNTPADEVLEIEFVVLMDGWTYSEEGSGMMAVSPKVVEKGFC